MSLVKATVHGTASMVVVVLGAIISDAVSENVGVFRALSDAIVVLLHDVAQLPVSDELAGVILPVGILMAIWVFVYEVKTLAD